MGLSTLKPSLSGAKVKRSEQFDEYLKWHQNIPLNLNFLVLVNLIFH
jgi:hypothetical protein